jgi:hypothetical protein
VITVARWILFAFWCLVLWGTLWDLSVLWRLASQGSAAAAEIVLKTPPEPAAAAWGNRGCGLLAVFAWVALPLARWSSSRRTA